MKTITAFQFDMQPKPGQTSRECLTAVRLEVVEWIQGIFRSRGVHNLHLPFDGSSVSPTEGHDIETLDRDCDTHRLAAVTWELPEPRAPFITWQFFCALACDARAVQAAFGVRVRREMFLLRPLDVALDNQNPLCTVAALRDKLVQGWNCRIEGQPIPTRNRLLRKNHIDAFVREVLLNSSRVLPVVLFTLGGRLKMAGEALQDLQKQLLGLAHVAALQDRPATDRLTKLVGPQLCCDEQVVRVYWPGLSLDGVPQNHPYQTVEKLQLSLKTSTLSNLLLVLLGPVAGEQFREGRLVSEAITALAAEAGRPRDEPAVTERLAAAEAELDQSRQAQQRLQREGEASRRHVQALLDDLASLREQLAALRAAPRPEAQPGEKFDELAVELERAWDENRHLRAEWENARRQLAELEGDFRSYLDDSVLFWNAGAATDAPAAGPAPADGRRFASPAEALRAAAADFADVLVVWEDAERAAEQSPFGSPAKVFQALAAIAEVGRAYFQARKGGPPLGPMDRAFLSRVPFKYTCFESPTTLSLFGAERVFHHGPQSRQMQRHLTLGGGTTNNCLQIYFEFDEPTQRVLVGYCGRHLRYSSQRT